MELISRTNGSTAEITIELCNAKITEDLSCFSTIHGWNVEEKTIEQLFTVANDFSRFNKKTDIEFVLQVAEAFLNDAEKEEFIECLKETITS